MLRRLHKEQPSSFAFTPKNLEWAQGQISKYPEGRQASAIIPLLFRAQEQEGWLTRPAIEHVANLLGLAYIRALEVATFYFMFQLQPVGKIAHIQICGTTSCMICGAEELIEVCKELIAPSPYMLSADGNFSWEEVECLGACANAPAINIGKDYYEDLTAEKLRELIGRFSKGEVPVPGSQTGRYSSEPATGLTALKEYESGHTKYNGSVQRAVDIGDTIRRIDGTEVPILTPWRGKPEVAANDETAPTEAAAGIDAEEAEDLSAGRPEVKVDMPPGVAEAAPGQNTATGDKLPAAAAPEAAPAPKAKAKKAKASPEPQAPATPEAPVVAPAALADLAEDAEPKQPKALKAARKGKADDLKLIEGIGPVLEKQCNSLGIFHFDQIASWGPGEVAWMDANLKGFRGRVSRDKWVAQAVIIVTEGIEVFLERAKTNDY